ncbi:MAG: hypothetical protein N3E37_05025 [Candidatus Micrarchaeota archaeon]|nr:hypothetical protein [Candidatus Micrarchaeota archaeon]
MIVVIISGFLVCYVIAKSIKENYFEYKKWYEHIPLALIGLSILILTILLLFNY